MATSYERQLGNHMLAPGIALFAALEWRCDNCGKDGFGLEREADACCSDDQPKKGTPATGTNTV